MDLFSCIGIGLIIGLIGGICIVVWQVRTGMISRPPKTILDIKRPLVSDVEQQSCADLLDKARDRAVELKLPLGMIQTLIMFRETIRYNRMDKIETSKLILEFEGFLKDCGINDNDLSMLLVNAARSLCGWNMKEE